MTVRIRGIAFKAAIGTKRAQLLGELQHLADKSTAPPSLLVAAGLVVGFGAGFLGCWWGL